MKNNTKSIVLLITLMLMVCLLIGCSNAATQPEVEPVEQETTIKVEETTVEEPEVIEEEILVEEEPAETEETEEPVAVDEPLEVISIKEYTEVTDYIATLDPDQPEIIIFNGIELYMIHMKEGQHYQLKTDDEIIFSYEGSGIGYGWNIELGNSTISIDNHNIFKADYSKFEQDQEVYLDKKLESGEIVKRTCYLTPPTE